jgi:xylulokinase
VDDEGHTVALARRSYPLLVGPPGRVEADPEVVWKGVVAVVSAVARRARTSGLRIAALASSISSEDVVFVDDHGRPVRPAVMALDTRSARVAARWAGRVGARHVSEITGLPIHPAHPLMRLVWLRDAEPGAYRKVRQVLCWHGFLARRLGLPAVTDTTLAARTMAWDVRTSSWSAELLASARASVEVFPEVRPSGTIVGAIPDAGADALGVPRGAAFATGGLDQALATLGSGMTRPGQAMVGSGSWEAVTALMAAGGRRGSPRIDAAALATHGISLGPFVVNRLGMAMATQAGGGSLVRWLRDLVAPGRSVGEVIGRAPDRVSGLLVLPHIEGSYSPWMDPVSRAAVAGFGLGTTRGELVRGVLEGTAMELRLNLERMEAGGAPVTELRNTGGGARSRAWVQLKADVLGRPVKLVDVAENAAFGAACLAGQAVGLFPSAGGAAARFVQIVETVEPRPLSVSAYEEDYQRYRALYPAMREARALQLEEEPAASSNTRVS